MAQHINKRILPIQSHPLHNRLIHTQTMDKGHHSCDMDTAEPLLRQGLVAILRRDRSESRVNEVEKGTIAAVIIIELFEHGTHNNISRLDDLESANMGHVAPEGCPRGLSFTSSISSLSPTISRTQKLPQQAKISYSVLIIPVCLSSDPYGLFSDFSFRYSVFNFFIIYIPSLARLDLLPYIHLPISGSDQIRLFPSVLVETADYNPSHGRTARYYNELYIMG
jgi:hypothetical protein